MAFSRPVESVRSCRLLEVARKSRVLWPFANHLATISKEVVHSSVAGLCIYKDRTKLVMIIPRWRPAYLSDRDHKDGREGYYVSEDAYSSPLPEHEAPMINTMVAGLE